MENKFIKIISSPMMNTSNVQRYSGTKLLEPENLTVHILESQMMGYMIINHLNNSCGETLDRGLYLEKALHHDLEESITGDIVRPLKYHNSQVLKELQSVASEVAEEIYVNYFEDTTGELFDLWVTAKEGKEGFILKLVDTLTVVNKVVKEVDFLHNIYFLRVAYEVDIYLRDLLKSLDNKKNEFTPEAVKYLRDILMGAGNTLHRILSDSRDEAIRYNIIEKSLLREEGV